MRVAASIAYVELDGDYSTVDGVTATCSRCGACTESYGTSGASVRRCLVLLREQCNERNYYVAARDQDLTSRDYRAGYTAGYALGLTAGRQQSPAQLNAAQIRALVTLCHPDRHPPERFELANKATAALLGLLKDQDRKAA